MLYPRGAERNVGLLKGDWVIRIEESEELVVPQQLSFIFFCMKEVTELWHSKEGATLVNSLPGRRPEPHESNGVVSYRPPHGRTILHLATRLDSGFLTWIICILGRKAP